MVFLSLCLGVGGGASIERAINWKNSRELECGVCVVRLQTIVGSQRNVVLDQR